jgi:UDP-N-acetylmuramate: L-alanyl-gamma-D-glutamyl-meso-diaminopimelate ligase
MHIHILGICGTFMGGLAQLAKACGYRVTGSDAQVYPPMSVQLAEQGISLIEGYDVAQLYPKPDIVVIGNALTRGNPCVEAILNDDFKYTSGPQFLAEYILYGRQVIAVAGTHGKTTTTSMLAWILDQEGHDVGFLIGGVPQNFGVSARLGTSPYFLIEADEYDSAFFDKRSKFVHYRPRTLLINNLEFDHADIFDSLAAIQKQFHHLVRTVPSDGFICYPAEPAVLEVIEQGCWSNTRVVDAQHWHIEKKDISGQQLTIYQGAKSEAQCEWNLIGEHNAQNALMAVLGALSVGVAPQAACDALKNFLPPKRRLELLLEHKQIQIYDDFAHHPTAIASTLQAVKVATPKGRIIAVFEPRSATMKQGHHQALLVEALDHADICYLYQAPDLTWSLDDMMQPSQTSYRVCDNIHHLSQQVLDIAQPYDKIVIMSNGSFEGLYQMMTLGLQKR